MINKSNRNIYDRARELAQEFVEKSGYDTTRAVRERMAFLLERYYEHGELYHLNEICDLFEKYCGIVVPRYQ